MVRAATPIAVLLLAVVAAGCFGSSPAPSSAAVASGGPEASSTDANTTSLNETNATVILPPMKVAYSGKSPTGLCTYGLPSDTCAPIDAGSEGFHVFETKTKPTHVALQVAYSNVQPGMTFYASICSGKRGDANTYRCVNYTTSASPIKIDQDLRALPDDAGIALSVGAISDTSAPTGGFVSTSADFKVEGTLTLG